MDVRVIVEMRLTGPAMGGDDDAAWEALNVAISRKLEAETFHAPHGAYAVVTVDVDDLDGMTW